jgi:dephospho-CoA kinase
MTLKVGLTGGIGSGKSVVARIFEVLGIPVYYADAAARELQNTDPVLKEQLIGLFGQDAYNEGIFDRKYVSSLVFADSKKLEELNALVHPATIRNAAKWMAGQDAPYVIKEAALIFESGSQRDLDYVIGVTAPESLRISRTMTRDSLTSDEVRKRMEKQLQDRIKMRLCDFVIYNDESQLLVPQVLKIHDQLLSIRKNIVSK